jgi:hypothetical protein
VFVFLGLSSKMPLATQAQGRASMA